MGSISIVLPVYDAQPYLAQVLRPVVAAARQGEVVEAIAVDDSSSDESAEMCRRAGLTVIPSGSRCGPAACRNIGAGAASGDVILFVDADVVIHGDVIGKISEVFGNHPTCVAVFGSYDDQPAARGWVSQYRNLLHHYNLSVRERLRAGVADSSGSRYRFASGGRSSSGFRQSYSSSPGS